MMPGGNLMANVAIVDVFSGWLWARSPSSDFVIAELMISLPTTKGLDVFAEIGITSVSLGNVQGTGGIAATRVSGWTEILSPGGVDIHDTAPDPAENSLYASKCRDVFFRLEGIAA